METAAWVIELAVGLACLAIAVIAFRRPGLRTAAALFAIAGVAAAGHALLQLARG